MIFRSGRMASEPDWEKARRWLMNEKVTRSSAKVKEDARSEENLKIFKLLSGSKSEEYQDGGGVVQLPERWNRALPDDWLCDEGDRAREYHIQANIYRF